MTNPDAEQTGTSAQMLEWTDAQLSWLGVHPMYCACGKPKPGLRFHECGTLYADGRFIPMAPMKTVHLEKGCRLVGIPHDLYLTIEPHQVVPDFDNAARALGFSQLETGKWFFRTAIGGPMDHEVFFDSAEQIFDWWGKASGNAASQDAREALEPYCQHLQICSSRDPLFNSPCDCGLEAALAALQSAPALSGRARGQMTREQIDAIPRKEARQLLASIPAGQGYDNRVLLAVEQAMNLEWWRGYYAALPLEQSKTAENAGGDQSLVEPR